MNLPLPMYIPEHVVLILQSGMPHQTQAGTYNQRGDLGELRFERLELRQQILDQLEQLFSCGDKAAMRSGVFLSAATAVTLLESRLESLGNRSGAIPCDQRLRNVPYTPAAPGQPASPDEQRLIEHRVRERAGAQDLGIGESQLYAPRSLFVAGDRPNVEQIEAAYPFVAAEALQDPVEMARRNGRKIAGGQMLTAVRQAP